MLYTLLLQLEYGITREFSMYCLSLSYIGNHVTQMGAIVLPFSSTHLLFCCAA